MATSQNIRIRLKAFDHKLIDTSAREIVETARAHRRNRPRSRTAADEDRALHRAGLAAWRHRTRGTSTRSARTSGSWTS